MATGQFEWNPYSVAFRTAWTATPILYDILGNDPMKLNQPGYATPNEGRPCRWITCGGVGTIVVTGLDGVDVTLDATQVGQTFLIQATALKAASTATKVSVYW